MANQRRKKRKLLSAQAGSLRTPHSTLHIPVRWVNSVIGIFLLPVAVIWTQSFFNIFSRLNARHAFWATEEFWFFALGAVLWLIAFFGLPRPLLIYVFGHELTHVVWVWAMGGRVSQFSVGRDGGHIVTNKSNVWIALAPYFFPLYSILVIALYGGAGFFWNVAPYHRWLYAFIGVTWAFHISFTLWMIPKGQTDISQHGKLYSLVVIYLMNLLVLTIMLLVASPHATLRGFARELYHNTLDFSSWACGLVR
jgi:hypothetical protein